MRDYETELNTTLQTIVDNNPVLKSIFIGHGKICIRTDEQLIEYRKFIQFVKTHNTEKSMT